MSDGRGQGGEPQYYGAYGAAPRPGGGSSDGPYGDLVARLDVDQYIAGQQGRPTPVAQQQAEARQAQQQAAQAPPQHAPQQPGAAGHTGPYGPPTTGGGAPPPTWPTGARPGAPWASPRRPASRHRKRWVGLVVVLVIFALFRGCVAILEGVTGADDSSGPPSGTSAPAPTSSDVTATWQLAATDLREDLGAPELVGHVDGSFDGPPYLSRAGGTWVVLTGTSDDGEIVAHGVDRANGNEQWERELDGALCAPEAIDAGLFCASVLERDQATGIGTRWRLHLLDPATGEDRATADVDAWASAVHVIDDTLVVLEEREPNPHAVVRGFSTELEQVWSRDLSKQEGHDEMFSRNRIIGRDGAGVDRDGVVLDRPRFREVGQDGGTLAIWAGSRTAFLDPANGELVMMPHCSRLVDDGERLWCNEGNGVVAYSYRGERLHEVRTIRLLFPDTDGNGDTDVTRPVFADDDGRIFSVDLDTGQVNGPFQDLGTGSAFGMPVAPAAGTSQGHTFVSGENGIVLLAPDADEVIWHNRDVDLTDPPIVRTTPDGDVRDVLVGSFDTRALSMDTGQAVGPEINQPYGIYTGAVGDEIVGRGPEVLALLDVP
ncbi:hypothetical protein [Georgenia alba]|uniref:PQQ-binding-like beta-propeller repeat protein n=1 Tax=Georgenia alba TaxID=2233858 RepID=A0ABW2QBD1_9MICO